MLNPKEIIEQKRAGQRVGREDLARFIKSYVSGKVPDYQMSAFLMAVFFRGMETGEILDLVNIMLESGKKLDLSDIGGYKLDKHSTGGVGDKISLILAPLLASLGINVPMISGRGLAHSGGTLDKLESIPGLTTSISQAKFKRVLKKTGFVIAGQTDDLVPADKRIYSLRDATATVDSLPLVVSSIMSKKLAEGLNGLVLDIKTGKGAFFKRKEAAIKLAVSLREVGEQYGVPTRPFLTNMNRPLGHAIGNWLEVKEAIDCLKGEGPEDTMTLVRQFALAGLELSGSEGSRREHLKKIDLMISSGRAFEKFLIYVHQMGGSAEMIEKPEKYAMPKGFDVLAPGNGMVADLDALELGMAAAHAGAGRINMTDKVDPAAGIFIQASLGDRVSAGDLLATCYTQVKRPDQILDRICRAFSISERARRSEALILGEIDGRGRLIKAEV